MKKEKGKQREKTIDNDENKEREIIRKNDECRRLGPKLIRRKIGKERLNRQKEVT